MAVKEWGFVKGNEGHSDDTNVIGGDPPREYLARHRFVDALVFADGQCADLPLQSKNPKNRVLLLIVIEIWRRNWGEVMSAVFRFLLRNTAIFPTVFSERSKPNLPIT